MPSIATVPGLLEQLPVGPSTTFIRGSPTGLFTVHGESEQYVTGHAAKPRIAGIDIKNAINNHGPRAVKRTAAGWDPVYGGELVSGVEVPKEMSVFGREGPDMSVH